MLQAEREGRARDKLDLDERRGLASVGELDLSTLGTDIDGRGDSSVDPQRPSEGGLRTNPRASSASPRAGRHDHRVLTGSTVAVSRGSSVASREAGAGEREQRSWDDAEDKMSYRAFVEPRDTQSLPRPRGPKPRVLEGAGLSRGHEEHRLHVSSHTPAGPGDNKPLISRSSWSSRSLAH